MGRHVLDERGMTVAEILIAVAIIGVGLVALSSAIPLAAYGIQEGNQRLEQIRNAAWQAARPAPAVPAVAAVDKLGVSSPDTAAPVGDGGVITFPDETPIGAPYAGYTRTVRIRSCDVGLGCGTIIHADLRQVTVTVSYRPMTGIGVAPAGTTKSAVVTMYIAKR